MDRRVDVGTSVDAERKLGNGRGVASVEMLRLFQLNARIARIVNHLVTDPDCNVDPPITARRSVKNSVLGFHQPWTSLPLQQSAVLASLPGNTGEFSQPRS
jgi:hypothetical protein